MKKLFFILIPVHFVNAMEVAKKFNGHEFSVINDVPDIINKELTQEEESEEDEEVLVMSTTRFVEFYNASGTHTQYVVTPVYIG